MKFTTSRAICQYLNRTRSEEQQLDCYQWTCYKLKVWIPQLVCNASLNDATLVPQNDDPPWDVGVGGVTGGGGGTWIPVPEDVYDQMVGIVEAIENESVTTEMFLRFGNTLVDRGNAPFALDITDAVPELLKVEAPVFEMRAECLAQNFELQAKAFTAVNFVSRATVADTLAEHFRVLGKK